MTTETCAVHPEKAVRWSCEKCQAPLCERCGAGAFQGKIYCSRCLGAVQLVEPSARPASKQGVGLGIGLAFACLVLPGLIAWLIALVLRQFYVSWNPWLSGLGFVLNPFVFTGLAILMAKRRGRHGIAKGLVIGLIIWVSLTVLLVAACFGVFFASGWLSRWR